MAINVSVLFLTYRIAQGFGVDEVVLQYCRTLNYKGILNQVLCVERLTKVDDVHIKEMLPSVEGLSAKITSGNYTHVIAHTEPWISLLAEAKLPSNVQKVAWEHGDPTPELFQDAQESTRRRGEKANKLANAYPKMDSVVAISEFVREDIGWPAALVIPNPVPDFPAAPDFSPREKPAPLKLGCLMRLGPGEAQYKGRELFLELCEEIKHRRLNVEILLAGRGSAKDAEAYVQKGIRVMRNLSFQEKQDFLTSLDLFLSPSLWEGFNLPVVEAQALGVPSMLFDAGAHPEVCPHVMSTPEQALCCISSLERNREQLERWSTRGLKHLQTLRSHSRPELFIKFLGSSSGFSSPTSTTRASTSPLRLTILGIRHGLKSTSVLGFVMWLLKKTGRKVISTLKKG